MVWSVVLAKYATLQEIESHWSFLDLLDCHEAMSVKSDLERRAIEEAKNG
jgi:hypothetical protein